MDYSSRLIPTFSINKSYFGMVALQFSVCVTP